MEAAEQPEESAIYSNDAYASRAPGACLAAARVISSSSRAIMRIAKC